MTTDRFAIALRAALIEARRAAGHATCAAGARASGIQYNTYWRFESGAASPSLATLRKIARGFKTTPGNILIRAENIDPDAILAVSDPPEESAEAIGARADSIHALLSAGDVADVWSMVVAIALPTLAPCEPDINRHMHGALQSNHWRGKQPAWQACKTLQEALRDVTHHPDPPCAPGVTELYPDLLVEVWRTSNKIPPVVWQWYGQMSAATANMRDVAEVDLEAVVERWRLTTDANAAAILQEALWSDD